MAKTKAKQRDPDNPWDYVDMWACEFCGAMHEGVNPPDSCVCGHEYFENVCDLLTESVDEKLD